ncbi:hypothetical protein AVEN_35067-1 [Araneus ventricosus]|uniref:Uncharacterized protein n=1 Tax=Araneus ventricosus TaxID=182803 RepID=A0A4Y2UNI0_ARAVE|nr:hypothetical protein AVEN_264435-1 [Araneus ventricosus]GBO13725.1 hypothetical protein AVEN_35067-1 [Araneus ventricosus]
MQKLSKETEEEKKIRREKDRINHAKHRLKQKGKKHHHISSPSKAFGNNQALGKAISRAKNNLPNSPNKRVAVIQKLASQYYLLKTTQVGNNGIDDTTKEAVICFYANDNISSQAAGKVFVF